jgi:hypothetical protein
MFVCLNHPPYSHLEATARLLFQAPTYCHCVVGYVSVVLPALLLVESQFCDPWLMHSCHLQVGALW